MYIKNKCFFHLHKPIKFSDKWRIDNVLNFSNKQLNNFNSFYEHYSPTLKIDNIAYEPFTGLENIIKNKIHTASIENANYVISELRTMMREQSIYIREQIFEEVRKNYFPSLPSRKTCIWVCEKEAVSYWLQALNNQEEIYKLELTGILHKADQKHLTVQLVPHEELKRNAFNYWTGSDGSKKIEEEYLFEGIVSIKEKYSSLEDMLEKNTN